METIELEDGKIAALNAVEQESDKVRINQLIVDGHKFTCSEKFRKVFEEYLASIKSAKVELIFLHSIRPKYTEVKSVATSKKKSSGGSHGRI